MVASLFRITSKITALARSGRITCARNLFDEMPSRDTVAWNTMLTSYSHLHLHQEALSLFTYMRISNSMPDNFSFTAILRACAGLGEVRIGRKVHALVILFGYESSLPVNNSLINMYGKCFDPCSASAVFKSVCGSSVNEITWCSLLFAYVNAGKFEAAHDVFHKMPKRVLFAWNIMISGHARDGDIESCLGLFREMEESVFSPDFYTFSALMNACTESSEFFHGCMLHAVIVKTGWDIAAEAKNSVLSFYSKLGCKDDAMKEFESPGMLTQVSWNAMIDAYMKIGETDEAFNAFQLAPEKNIISWTSMIAGYAKNGNGELALRFFVDMMESCVDPDYFAFGAVLHACSCMALLGHGRMVHGCAICHGFQGYAYVGNGLVNMYAKCGDIKESSHAFGNIINKDLVSWNTMLLAFGVHGLASQALKLYEDMKASGTKPDKVTFIGLLITCSHSGLIDEGRTFFESMRKDYRLPYEEDHVACMVDMLGRGGHLTEAAALAKTYNTFLGNGARTSSWEALLGACSTHLERCIGTNIGENLKIWEPSEEMSFVLLSNLYSASGQWKEAEMVRREMAKRGVKKRPGCSWIQVRNEISAFVAGDSSNQCEDEFSEMLHYLELEIRNPSLSGF